MNYEKFYIGKGTQVPHLQICKITVKMDLVEEIAYERDGVRYATFEVAKMKEPDKFGRDYTCYVSKRADAVAEPAPEKAKKPKKEKKANLADQNLTF